MGQDQSSSSDDDDYQLEDESSSQCRHLCLISLKHDLRTFMDKLAREIRNGEIPSLRGKVLIMIDLQKFNTKSELLPSRVLLGHMFQNSQDPQVLECYEWMISNQQKLIFMIYCLDTYPYELVWKRPPIGYYKTCSADIVIHNLLAKNLFQSSLVISSTGQSEFENIHPLCHPDYYIEMDGINDHSSFAHIRELLKRNPLEKSRRVHKNIWPQGPQFEEAMEAMGMLRAPSATEKSKYSKARTVMAQKEFEAKRRMLAEHMIDALNNETNERKRLEHLLTIYEGREASAGVVRNSIKAFDLSDVPFNNYDTEAVSFLIALAKNLEIVNLRNCALNSFSMEVMADTIMESTVKIDRLDVSRNELQTRGMQFLAKLIKHCKVKSLNLSDCGLRLPYLQKLLAGTTGCKVPELNVCQNELGVDSMPYLGKLVKQWNVKHLDMSNCSLTGTHLKKFLDGAGGIMLEFLDLSDWTDKPSYVPQLLDFVTRVRREINIYGWGTESIDQDSIQAKLDKTNSKVLVVKLLGGLEMRAKSRQPRSDDES